MAWTLTEDHETFLAQADGFLRNDPIANTVPLTVIEAMRMHGHHESALFGWWTDRGPVEGTFIQTGSRPLLLSPMPERAAQELADTLAKRGATVPGVNGTPVIAEAFSATWTNRTGTTPHVAMRERLYRLDRLHVPTPPPDGAARPAESTDRELVVDLFASFSQEIGNKHSRVDMAAIDAALTAGRFALWETAGRPVALAGRKPIIAGTARVGPVFTPPEHRRHGYGAAVTAAVTRMAQDAGATDVVLFTDLANQTSNNIYQHLGYRPVHDGTVITFT